jgi:hypothetical protein
VVAVELNALGVDENREARIATIASRGRALGAWNLAVAGPRLAHRDPKRRQNFLRCHARAPGFDNVNAGEIEPLLGAVATDAVE